VNVLALCAGIGGLELGVKFARPDAHAVCYVEHDRDAVRVLRQRIAAGDIDDAPIWNDVRTFDGMPWRGCVDLITAGYPCQPESTAGKRLGHEDERWLWADVWRIIRDVEPRYVTWPRAGGVSNGTAYLRLPWAPRTSAIAYSLSLHGAWLAAMLPTPTRKPEHNSQNRSTGERKSLAMLASSGLLPTPCRSDSKRSGSAGYSTESGRHGGRTLTDCTVGPTRAQRRNGPTLTDCVDGPIGARQKRRLNPAYVEWMLGLPAGWTC
jgi:hypothetical protein